MLISRKRGSDWDLENELNKVNVRWFMIVIISGYLFYLLGTGSNIFGDVKGTFSYSYIATLALISGGCNMIYHLILYRIKKLERSIHPAWKYISMAADFLLVTCILLPTGGDESMFFLVYFVVIVSNGIRYGMRLAVAGVLLFNLLYFAALFYQYYPERSLPAFQTQFLKVIGVWLVGLYIGYLSQRFEALQHEISVYRKLLAQNPGKETKTGQPTEKSPETDSGAFS